MFYQPSWLRGDARCWVYSNKLGCCVSMNVAARCVSAVFLPRSCRRAGVGVENSDKGGKGSPPDPKTIAVRENGKVAPQMKGPSRGIVSPPSSPRVALVSGNFWAEHSWDCSAPASRPLSQLSPVIDALPVELCRGTQLRIYRGTSSKTATRRVSSGPSEMGWRGPAV